LQGDPIVATALISGILEAAASAAVPACFICLKAKRDWLLIDAK
jgi:hypothetical protein